MGARSLSNLKNVNRTFDNVLDSFLNLTDGGSVVGKFGLGAQTVAAAGADQAGAGAISATGGGTVIVTGADDAKGVRLPLLSDCNVGQQFFIMNNLVNKTLEVYPGSGDAVNVSSDNTPITIAADTIMLCIKMDDAEWFGAELPVVGA
tara:strand:+ start:67 stop:510 length:444 start_codon:yes stop_codon:yes gene_type:complete